MNVDGILYTSAVSGRISISGAAAAAETVVVEVMPYSRCAYVRVEAA